MRESSLRKDTNRQDIKRLPDEACLGRSPICSPEAPERSQMATHSFLIRCPLPHRRWNRELCDSRQPASLLSAAQTSKQVGCAIAHSVSKVPKPRAGVASILNWRGAACMPTGSYLHCAQKSPHLTGAVPRVWE